MKNRISIPCALAFMLSVATHSQAKGIYEKPSEDSTNIAIVRESIISKGIYAYRIGNFRRAVWLLKTFINPRKVVVTPTEKEGLKCLALAYQKLGKRDLAVETMERLKSSVELSAVKLTKQYYCSQLQTP